MSQRFTPRRSGRGTGNYEFFELALALGPASIGVTGDNSYEVLYGREYLLVWDLEDDLVKLYRETATDGVWDRITVGLPPLFDTPLPSTARHVTFAFDQSARVIFVYEDGGEILVTRWDTVTSQYIQNVSFPGVDPCLLMDATVVDPRGYPNLADDGWSVQEAYYAGIRVLFEWLAEAPATFRDNPITDSDIVLFYLTPDRLEVKARVQRELYATVNDLWTFAQPVVLDRAVALFGKYQLLVSDAAGDKLANMLISDPYVGDLIINPQLSEPLAAGIAPEDEVLIEQPVRLTLASETVVPGIEPEPEVVINTTTFISDGSEILVPGIEPEGEVRIDTTTFTVEDDETVAAGITPEDAVRIDLAVVKVTSQEALDVGIAPESTLRIQGV